MATKKKTTFVVSIRQWQDGIVEVEAVNEEEAEILALDALDAGEVKWQDDDWDITDVEEVEE